MSEEEIRKVAWRLLVDGAESSLEDWTNEEGALSADDADKVYEAAWAYLDALTPPVLSE